MVRENSFGGEINEIGEGSGAGAVLGMVEARHREGCGPGTGRTRGDLRPSEHRSRA